MTTLYISHPIFLEHETPPGHPERPDRLRAIEDVLQAEEFDALQRELARPAPSDVLGLAHFPEYIAHVQDHAGTQDLIMLDADTSMGPHSYDAALHAVGAALRAVDAVINSEVQNAFCAVRPPGHHAERGKAMGFCLFSTAAIAARYAQQIHDLKKIAIVDFDVHHGNGTQDVFFEDPTVLYASSHQWPCYPGTGAEEETGAGNIINVALAPGTGSAEFRNAYMQRILPALDAFEPDLVIISAGFDAHWRDPLAQLELTEEDFAWVTRELRMLADRHAGGRIVSLLEGGYDLEELQLSVMAHVHALMG